AKRGAAHPSDGRNLILHEFAHQLDYEEFQTDGAPALATRAEYLTWARVMSREFAALQSVGETGTSTVLDTYGATNPAEFFAVVTEAFFERRARSAAGIRNCMPNSPGSFARIPVATRPRLQQHLKASSTGAAHRWF